MEEKYNITDGLITKEYINEVYSSVVFCHGIVNFILFSYQKL